MPNENPIGKEQDSYNCQWYQIGFPGFLFSLLIFIIDYLESIKVLLNSDSMKSENLRLPK